MNRILTNFLTLITMLCLSVSNVFAKGDYAGDYLTDMEIDAGFLGASSAKDQTTTVTYKETDNLYNVNFGSISVAKININLNFKNLEEKGSTLVWGNDSYLDGAKDVTITEFIAKEQGDGSFAGNISLNYSGYISATIQFTMSPKPAEVETPIEDSYFMEVPYYNTINNVDKTKNTFDTLSVSLFKNYANIYAPSYVVKLAENKNLTVTVPLNLNKLPYTTINDSLININGVTTFSISEYMISTKTDVNVYVDTKSNTITEGTFSYSIGGDGSMIDIFTNGTKFNVVCHFGDGANKVEIVEDILDFDFDNATRYFATIEPLNLAKFENVYLNNKGNSIALFPVKMSGIAQDMAIVFDVEIDSIKHNYPDYKIEYNNLAVKAYGMAKQYIKTNGAFTKFSEDEAYFDGILSADEQFVGTVKVGGSVLNSIDTKAPVVLYPGMFELLYHPICGISNEKIENPIIVDTVMGLLPMEVLTPRYEIVEVYPGEIIIPEIAMDSITITDEQKNKTRFVMNHIVNRCKCIYPSKDTVIEYKYNGNDAPYIDATKDIEKVVREFIGETDCDYNVSIPERAKTCKLGETLFNIKVGEFESNITVRLLLASSVNNVENNASSISYSNGVLSVSGYDAENIELFSIIGTKVLSVPMAEKTNISLAKGVYLVKVGNATEKVVVK